MIPTNFLFRTAKNICNSQKLLILHTAKATNWVMKRTPLSAHLGYSKLKISQNTTQFWIQQYCKTQNELQQIILFQKKILLQKCFYLQFLLQNDIFKYIVSNMENFLQFFLSSIKKKLQKDFLLLRSYKNFPHQIFATLKRQVPPSKQISEHAPNFHKQSFRRILLLQRKVIILKQNIRSIFKYQLKKQKIIIYHYNYSYYIFLHEMLELPVQWEPYILARQYFTCAIIRYLNFKFSFCIQIKFSYSFMLPIKKKNIIKFQLNLTITISKYLVQVRTKRLTRINKANNLLHNSLYNDKIQQINFKTYFKKNETTNGVVNNL
eukprot:TRINITY_DN6654_c0_g2_i10.p1 TRINITY_DN6654_c0_g2~~TRINITY_DN6654_c0_g2_i10.p1  ORF type:complete len:321 (+),score=-5.89 TRINITY_DN6654_c0_g2_i10:772-1734(+)